MQILAPASRHFPSLSLRPSPRVASGRATSAVSISAIRTPVTAFKEAVRKFSAFRAQYDIKDLVRAEPVHIAAFVEERLRENSKPVEDQRLAVLRIRIYPCAIVSGNTFQVLEMEAAQGRLLTPTDDQTGGEITARKRQKLGLRQHGTDEGLGRVWERLKAHCDSAKRVTGSPSVDVLESGIKPSKDRNCSRSRFRCDRHSVAQTTSYLRPRYASRTIQN